MKGTIIFPPPYKQKIINIPTFKVTFKSLYPISICSTFFKWYFIFQLYNLFWSQISICSICSVYCSTKYFCLQLKFQKACMKINPVSKLVLDVSIYMQPTTSADDIFRCICFTRGQGLTSYNLSQCMRFPTMWYERPAKHQISLRIRAVWSEPLLFAWVFYVC